MTILELPIDSRIDVVLARLAKDIDDNLWAEWFDYPALEISFFAYREDNTIIIKSRILRKRKNEQWVDGNILAEYKVSRVTDIADDESYNRSILKFSCGQIITKYPYNQQEQKELNLEYEKIAFFYLARLGIALKAEWASAINATLEQIKAEIVNTDNQTAQGGAAESGSTALPNEIVQIEKVAQNPTLQNALKLYIFNPEMTLADIARETKYKNQNSLATLIAGVRRELKHQYGEQRQNELLPNRKLNSSWRNQKSR
jgi:hypothetical protein